MGPILLISSLHVLHHYRLDPIKIKYYGVFLYQTHLIMVKVKKRDVYEPREWLPLRLFDLVNIEEGEGKFVFNLIRLFKLLNRVLVLTLITSRRINAIQFSNCCSRSSFRGWS